MSELREESKPYEIVIRIDEDGVPHAQASYRLNIYRGDQRIAAIAQPAQPLSLDQLGRDTWIGDVIGDVAATALATVDHMAAEINKLRMENDDTKAALTERTGQLTKAVDLLRVARSKIAG